MVRCWQDSNLRGKIPMDFESIALTTRPQQLAKCTQVMSIENTVKSSRARVRWRPTLIFVDQWTLMLNSNRRSPKSFGRVPNCLPNIYFTVQSPFAASCVLFLLLVFATYSACVFYCDVFSRLAVTALVVLFVCTCHYAWSFPRLEFNQNSVGSVCGVI